MPPVRRHSEQLQLVAVSGAAGSARRTEPQWQDPFNEMRACSSCTGIHHELSRLSTPCRYAASRHMLSRRPPMAALNGLFDQGYADTAGFGRPM